MFEMRVAVARRVARLVAGVILLVGAGRLVAWYFGADSGPALAIIASSWILAALGAGAVLVVFGLCWSPRWATSFPPWFEHLSLALPAVGAGLLGPLTLHIPFALLLSDAQGFETWAKMSIVVTALPHLVAAALIAVRARQLVRGQPAMKWSRIVLAAMIVACVPWVIALGIPPLIVGNTGLAMFPLAVAMDRVAERDRAERAQLAGWTAMPEAIIVERGHRAA